MAEEIPVPNKKLHGKVAIITGAASGISEVTAGHLADHGARMVVIADVQDTKGREVATTIGSDRCVKIIELSELDENGELSELSKNGDSCLGKNSSV
uniref:(-)-isopiperitenol/(-)-carveol dehydrogenase, mitochondrial-like n=1 Tax=Fragaria vesca subsp. vesca TaxID=101020 RepID=UPI0005C9CAA8|nr:PREDICTED: (-)-isopiperitenol/(-)-carveol dehydrogenase, mitochondrial-like [Fragaria vesca subsp. vesca]